MELRSECGKERMLKDEQSSGHQCVHHPRDNSKTQLDVRETLQCSIPRSLSPRASVRIFVRMIAMLA